MPITLPISNTTTDFDFFITLDEVRYLLQFRYNYRSSLWMLNILDGESAPVYMGIPIHVFQDLLAQVRSYDVPQKLLLCMNNLSENDNPTRDSFSEEVVLLYDVLGA